MGFPTELVLSSEEHTQEFICPVCLQLVDYESATILRCSHVFCGACVSEWFEGSSGRRRDCPVCKTNVLGGADGGSAAVSGMTLGSPLRSANPLAHRILNHVRVKCPLSAHGCAWKGDYSEVNDHLTSSAAHTAQSPGVTDEETAAAAAPSAGAAPAGAQPTASPSQPPAPSSAPAPSSPSSSVSTSAPAPSFLPATGAPAASSATPASARAETTALALKDQANSQFQSRNFNEAIKLYTKAVSVCPTLAVLRLNRAAAYLMLGRHDECVADCDEVIAADPANAKAHARKAKSLAQRGKLAEAALALEAGVRAVTGPPPAYGAPPPPFDQNRADAIASLRADLERVRGQQSLLDAGRDKLASGEHGEAARLFGEVMQHCDAPSVQLLAARAQLGVGACDWAIRVTLQVLRREPSNAVAYAVRAEALLLVGEFDDALRLARQAVKLNPDDDYAKAVVKRLKTFKRGMKEAKTAAEARDFETAAAWYTELIDAGVPDKAPLYATLHAERANAMYRVGRHEDALRDCARAINAKDDCRRAWLVKRLALHGLGRHEEALREMESLTSGWGTNDATLRHARDRAEFELRKSKRPDYYELLGCKRVASEPEIKAAYRARALELHPDKHTDKPDDERARAEEGFKLIGEALEVLGDPMKRQLYDEGYDKQAIEERVAAAQRAAHASGHHH